MYVMCFQSRNASTPLSVMSMQNDKDSHRMCSQPPMRSRRSSVMYSLCASPFQRNAKLSSVSFRFPQQCSANSHLSAL